jgi:hypothetical protein
MMKEKIAAIPVLLFAFLAFAVTLLRLFAEASAWLDALAWAAVGLAVINPSAFLILLPLYRALGKAAGGYMVKEAVTMEGVGRETLDRSAAIAEGESVHPIAVCLRAYCGDVAAPPDKYIEMAGLGVSAQFSGQMIHAGSAEYMTGLNIEVPDVPGRTAYIALEGRLLGYYRLLGPAETGRVRFRLMLAFALCAAFKLTVWLLAVFTQTGYIPGYIALETGAFVIAVAAALDRK